MIKKLIGMLFALATAAVLVFAVLGRDRYRSWVWPDGIGSPQPAENAAAGIVGPAVQPAPAPASPASSAARPDTLDHDAAAPAESQEPQADYFEDAEELPADLFPEESL